MKKTEESYDVVVCGGGLAGFCAAVAAARHGAKTCLVHDRPVLGGNASSEVRVTVHGAACHHSYARETGILSEILIEERARNHEVINENGWTNSVIDQVLYDIAQRTPNLTLWLNTSVRDVLLGDNSVSALEQIPGRPLPDTAQGYYHRPACATERKISAVVATVANAEVELTLRGKTFIDCTGDGLVADLAGCEWRMGSESKEQTGELHAPAAASTATMGNSIHIRARDIGRPAPYTAPPWVKPISGPDFFYKQGRPPTDLRGGFWWIEIGIPWHTIHDNEQIRHELTAWALAIWDWMKNRDEKTKGPATNYALEWMGQVTGKRESRRIMGQYLLTEHDIQANVVHPDEIAFGGWFVDLHTPGGLLAETSEPASAEGYKSDSDYTIKSYVGPYGVPLGSCIAKDVDNLLLAGRCVSATHAALGTVRVMATTGLVGEAVGIGAALALEKNIPVAKLGGQVQEIQQRLLRDGCFLPNYKNRDPLDLAQTATATASSEALSHGMGPDDAYVGGWVERHPSQPAQSLEKTSAQYIAVSGKLDSVSVCLDNTSDTVQTIQAKVKLGTYIWDYQRDRPILAETTLTVPPGKGQWIEWPVGLTELADGFVRLELDGDQTVSWRIARGILPGQIGAWGMGPKRLRRSVDAGTMAFQVSPSQSVYGPRQVLSGVTRPQAATNLWRSEPGRPLPQWVQLAWDEPQTIREVGLTFPGHLLKELHGTPPFARDPQTPKDYIVQAWVNEAWQDLVTVRGNYQRHHRYPFSAPVTTKKLRVYITATNGDPSAAVYEIRAYA